MGAKLLFKRGCAVAIIIFIINISITYTNERAAAMENQYPEQVWELFLEGKNLESDVNPFATSAGMILPIRVIIEKLGGEINWIANTKEVYARIGNQNLYVDFNQQGIAVMVAINGAPIDRREYRVEIVSDRTMINLNLVQDLIDKQITKTDKLQLVHIKDHVESVRNESYQNKSVQVEEILQFIHEADQQLFKMFRDVRKGSYQQLEVLLLRYFSQDIAQTIIDNYYRRHIDESYTVIPTNLPITLLPLSQIKQFKLNKSIKDGQEKQVLSVLRKTNMFATFSTHTVYELILVNKQWIIVEITHKLVENKVEDIDMFGGKAV